MDVYAGPQFQRRVHAHPFLAFYLTAVVAHVLDAGIRVLRYVLRQRCVRRVVPARGRNRHRNAIQPLPVYIQIFALPDNFLARRIRYLDWVDGIGGRSVPGFLDLVQLAADAGAIDIAASRQHADGDGDVEFTAF